MSETIREGVGVIVARLQTADLHEGHHAVFAEAGKHHKLCVFIGVNPSQLNTPSDPLDYGTREQMVKDAYPRAQVFPIVDQYTDDEWSKSLDGMLRAIYPRDRAVLYGGRDSFANHYSGRHRVVEIDSIKNVSATDLRRVDGSVVENHASFRRGVIYAACNRWTPIYPCVDVICENDTGNVLVGRRHNEGGVYRLPGGHIDPTDAWDEYAAKRELREETGVEASDFKHIWSGAINSWTDRTGGGVKRTVLFRCTYVHGPAKAADDLDEVVWVSRSHLESLMWADDHLRLVQIYLEDWSKRHPNREDLDII